MIRFIPIIIGGLFFIAEPAAAQNTTLFRDSRPPVIINNDTLDFPWTGGFNSVIINELDFDGDNDMDLILFDRVGDRITTFINDGITGQSSYRYYPDFALLLPPVHDWLRTVDVDCDGDKDIVTYTNSAMGVWRNDFSPGSGLQFSLITSQLNSWYGPIQNSIFVTSVNMPAITDADGDGDLDVITFANSSNYLEYHRNYAMDSLGTCDAFRFSLEPYCWGYFKLSALTNIALLNQNCRSGLAEDPSTGLAENNRHAGSVLTPMDQGCDGDVDILNGDLLGPNMLFLENGGTPDSAYITAQDSAFPVYDVQINMQNLPGAYYLDLDNDNLKDLFVSPFATVGEDFNNLHFYRNTSDNCSNVFDFVKTRFISDQTIDVGTAANIALFDVDQDGLTDIIAGNDYYFNPNPQLAFSRLAWFRNTGTANSPAFTLITDDWLGLSGLTQYGLYPAFGDLDGDNDADLLLGNADGILIYYQNAASPGQPCNFIFTQPQYQGIDIGNNSTPQILDVNRDGKNDLLIGERSGVINYFENTGSTSAPVFNLVSSNFGGVNVIQPGAVAGYSNPLMVDFGSGYELLVGSDAGRIYRYTNIDGNLGGTFTQADTMFQGIEERKRITIAMADLDADTKPDLIAGCNAGGMRLYTQDANLGVGGSDLPGPVFRLWPNPSSSGQVWLEMNQLLAANSSALVRIYDVAGNLVISKQIQDRVVQLSTSQLTSGYYLVEINLEHRRLVQKMVVRN